MRWGLLKDPIAAREALLATTDLLRVQEFPHGFIKLVGILDHLIQVLAQKPLPHSARELWVIESKAGRLQRSEIDRDPR